MTEDGFSSGMAALAQAFGVEPVPEMVELWWLAVQSVDDAAWKRAVLRTVQTTDTTYGKFPPPGLVLKHVEPELQGEAVAAYDRVIAAGVYGPESGTVWTFRTVQERCGRAAAEAFLEAGGHEAFRSEYGSDRRRERFIAAYQRVAREEPGTRVLPAAAPVALIGAGDEPRPQTAGEATVALEQIRKVIGAAPARPSRPPLSDEEWERRKAVLQSQARDLTGEGAA